MASRERFPREDHRRWGMPTIWVILIVMLFVACSACCGGINRFGSVFH